MKFALFYIGQYVLNFALAILTTTVFLGGWQGPGVAALASNPDPKMQLAAGILSLGYMPVSYTHLDVYKRQPMGSS